MELFIDKLRLINKTKVEVAKAVKKQNDLKTIVANLKEVGVKATITKSRVELLKVLTPPAQAPHPQN